MLFHSPLSDPRKVMVVEETRAKDERPIVMWQNTHRCDSASLRVVRSSESVRPEIAGPSVPVAASAEAIVPKPQRSKKKRVIYDSKGLPVAPHPPKRLRTDYGTAGGSVIGGKSLSALNRLCFRIMTEAITVAPRWLIPADISKGYFLSSEVRDACGVNILEKRKWRTLAEEKSTLLEAEKRNKNKEIEDLMYQLLGHREEVAEVTQLPCSARMDSLKLRVTHLRLLVLTKIIKHLCIRGILPSLKSQNQSLVDRVHELEVSSTDLREKLEMYEDLLKRLEEYQDKLMEPLRTRLAEIDTDFTRCCMRFQENFHPHLLNVIAGRRALGFAFGRAIEKGMQEGLAAGIEHGQAGRCLTDLEAYIPSAEDDFNSAIRELRDLNFPLLQELSTKKDASTWDIMDLLRLDEALSLALDIMPGGRVEKRKMERIYWTSPLFVKGVFTSIDDPLSAEALLEPPAEVPATNVLSTVVIVPPADPSVSVEDYDNPDLADVVPENVILGSESEGQIDASSGDGLTFSQLDDEARDAVL
ncbi:hypothetical protein Tco_1174031 [Tanacetum coccineum]